MIPTKTDVKITGDLGGEKVKMILDQNSAVHLMTLFTDLYSDPALAIIREYSTNALDSHRAAGQTRPIEVTTPNGLSPFFIVKDYGLGMDADTIRNVYSRYGASTKRNSNDQIGMLGLGCKSALTYSSSFNITGIKDGIKTYVSVSRAEDGSGTMEIIGQSKTDEPNGVEIAIPASRHSIETKAKEFFSFWEPGTVLLNGAVPKNIRDEGEMIGDFLFLPERNMESDYIVMGNVPYKTPDEYNLMNSRGYWKKGSVVAWVDMAEVNFTPSRESLHMTNLTKTTLKRLRGEVEKQIKDHVSNMISRAQSHYQAWIMHGTFKEGPFSNYVQLSNFKGDEFPASVLFDKALNLRPNYVRKSWYCDAIRLRDTVIVTDYSYEIVHTTHRKKIIKFLEDKGYEPESVLFCEEIPSAKWFDAHPHIYSWNDVKIVKIPSSPRNPKTVKSVTYEYISENGYKSAGATVDTTKNILYASPTELKTDEQRLSIGKHLVKNNNQVLLVNKNQQKAFKKAYPQAQHLFVEIKNVIDQFQASLKEEDKEYLRSDWYERRFLGSLNPNKINDPEIVRLISIIDDSGNSKAKLEQAYQNMLRLASIWNIPFDKINKNGLGIFKTYPMLKSSSDYVPIEHKYLYINAVYDKKQESK